MYLCCAKTEIESFYTYTLQHSTTRMYKTGMLSIYEQLIIVTFNHLLKVDMIPKVLIELVLLIVNTIMPITNS